MKVLCISSFRGGVGKSLISSVLSCKYYERGYTVAMVDLNLYSPFSTPLLFNKLDIEKGIHDFLLDDETKIDEVVVDVSYRRDKRNKLYLIPTSVNASSIIGIIDGRYSMSKVAALLSYLRDELKIEVAVVDNTPGIYVDSLAVVSLSDLIILIAKFDVRDMLGIKLYASILQRLNKPFFLVLNMVPNELGIGKVSEYVFDKVGIKPITVIPYYEEIAEYVIGRSVTGFLNHLIEFNEKVSEIADLTEVKMFYEGR